MCVFRLFSLQLAWSDSGRSGLRTNSLEANATANDGFVAQRLVYGKTFQGVVGIRFLVVAAMARKFRLLQCDSGDPVIAPQTKNMAHVENPQHAFDWLERNVHTSEVGE